MSERWIDELGDRGEAPEVDAFIADVIAVCRRHGMSIGHEDGHGAFKIEDFDDSNSQWLGEAFDARKLGRKKAAAPALAEEAARLRAETAERTATAKAEAARAEAERAADAAARTFEDFETNGSTKP